MSRRSGSSNMVLKLSSSRSESSRSSSNSPLGPRRTRGRPSCEVALREEGNEDDTEDVISGDGLRDAISGGTRVEDGLETMSETAATSVAPRSSTLGEVAKPLISPGLAKSQSLAADTQVSKGRGRTSRHPLTNAAPHEASQRNGHVLSKPGIEFRESLVCIEGIS